jgi:alginate O-acetyltransferase complex protein AlgI
MTTAFIFTCFAWIVFRSENISQAKSILSTILSKSLFTLPSIFPKTLVVFIGSFVLIEWVGRKSKYALENIGLQWSRIKRFSFYYFIVIMIFAFSNTKQEFIYFQF